MVPGDSFFGDNHSFNETLFEEVSIETRFVLTDATDTFLWSSPCSVAFSEGGLIT